MVKARTVILDAWVVWATPPGGPRSTNCGGRARGVRLVSQHALPDRPLGPGKAATVGAQPFGAFTPAAPTRRRSGAATRQWGAAGIVLLVLIATAMALIVYFVAR